MNGKIELEEHFNLAQFSEDLPPCVNPQAMKEIQRRLLDVTNERVADMDAAGMASASPLASAVATTRSVSTVSGWASMAISHSAVFTAGMGLILSHRKKEVR
jgi:hypothetical protein